MHWYWIFILVPEFNCLFCCFWSNFGQMVYVTQVKSYSFSSSESTFNFMGLWRKSGWSSTLSSVTSDSVTDQTTLSPQYNRFWFLIYAKQNLKWLHLHFCWLNGTLLCKKKDRLQIINLSRELFFEHQHLDRKKEFENTSNDDDTIGITLDLILWYCIFWVGIRKDFKIFVGHFVFKEEGAQKC